MGTDDIKMTRMAPVVAISSSKKRIAIADWNEIKVWSIIPDAFFKKEYGSRLPDPGDNNKMLKGCLKPWKSEQADTSGSDESYTTRCGHGCYHVYVRVQRTKTGPQRNDKRIVALEPIELPNRGVVYSMEFAEDDTLWAWTDKGLVKWHWGGGRDGKRQVMILPKAEHDKMRKSVTCFIEQSQCHSTLEASGAVD
jgi:hypothetical protein